MFLSSRLILGAPPPEVSRLHTDAEQFSKLIDDSRAQGSGAECSVRDGVCPHTCRRLLGFGAQLSSSDPSEGRPQT